MKMKNASGQEPREALVPKIRYFLWNYLVNRGVGRILYLSAVCFCSNYNRSQQFETIIIWVKIKYVAEEIKKKRLKIRPKMR